MRWSSAPRRDESLGKSYLELPAMLPDIVLLLQGVFLPEVQTQTFRVRSDPGGQDHFAEENTNAYPLLRIFKAFRLKLKEVRRPL